MGRQKIRPAASTMRFSAVGSRVDIPNNSQISSMYNAMTFRALVKRASTQRTSNEYLLASVSPANWIIRIDSLTDGRIRIYIDGSLSLSSALRLRTGKWEDVAVTMAQTDVNTVRVTSYLAGTLISTVNIAGSMALSGTPSLKLGVASTNAATFNGWMSEVMLFNQELTTLQLTDINQNGTTSVAPLMYYKLNEGSGSIALDSSDNRYNGTITNATYDTLDPPYSLRSSIA